MDLSLQHFYLIPLSLPDVFFFCLFVLHSACNYQQWRCLDGTCIPLESRCNNAYDCVDRSDEQNCPKGKFACVFVIYLTIYISIYPFFRDLG